MVEDYTYEDEVEDYEDEEQEDSYEDQVDFQEDMAPSHNKKDDLYSLFWKVIKTPDSSKVGNLNKDELGMLNISVRDLQRIYLLSLQLGHPHFGKFWLDQGEIILSTSSSKEGWLPELFVSSKTERKKSRKYNIQNLQNQPTQQRTIRKGLFKRRV